MDDVNDQLNKLSRQLDTLDDSSAKYQVRPTGPPGGRSQVAKASDAARLPLPQVVAEEYNKLKDLKQVGRPSCVCVTAR